jgi:hypothetical protein
MTAFAVHFDPEPEAIEARERHAGVLTSPSSIGEYRGDLDFLRDCHTGPDTEGGSNHYFDLWRPGALPVLARVHGLTNNHALFVDSHGKAGCSHRGSGYGYYPNDAVLDPGQKVSYFSAGDFAAVLGPTATAQIHNIVLAGCNEEGRFRSGEFRRHFINATNITYMSPGELSFKPMFYQAITQPSDEIKPLYGKLRRCDGGRVETEILDRPAPGAQPLGSYVSDLYLPGASKPFRTQKAGRELLDPDARVLRSLRADAENGLRSPLETRSPHR